MAKNFMGDFSSLLDNIGKQAQQEPEAAPIATPAEETTPKASMTPNAPQVEAKKRGRGRPRKNVEVEEQRTTLVLPVQLLKDLQAITYSETGRQGKKVLYKDIIADALQQYVNAYQKKNK